MTGIFEAIVAKSVLQTGGAAFTWGYENRKTRREFRHAVRDALETAAEDCRLPADTTASRVADVVMQEGRRRLKRTTDLARSDAHHVPMLGSEDFATSLKSSLPPRLIADLSEMGVNPEELFRDFGMRFPGVVLSRSVENSSHLKALARRIEADHLVKSTAAIAGGLDINLASTVDTLNQLLDESESRILRRLGSLTVPEDLMAAVRYSLESTELPDMDDSGLVLIEAEAGSGKSTLAERLHWRALGKAKKDKAVPLPLFLEANRIESTLALAVRRRWGANPEMLVRRIDLVLDGIEEVGPIRARRLLLEAQSLLRGEAPLASRILITSRPMSLGLNFDQKLAPPMLSDDDAGELVGLLSRNDRARWALSKVVRDAIHRPFFAIAAGLAMADSPGYSFPTQSSVIESVARRATQDIDWDDTSELLEGVAAASVDSHHGFVPIRDVVHSISDESRLAESRLLTLDNGFVAFQVALVAEWFAAEYLVHNLDVIEQIVDDPARLELWRYPLQMVVDSKALTQSEPILNTLARRAPAMAGWILSRPDSYHPWHRGTPTTEPLVPFNRLDLAEHMRRSHAAFAEGLAPMSGGTRLMSGGELVPLGIKVEARRCVFAWHDSNGEIPSVLNNPPHPLDRVPHDSWFGAVSTHITDHPAWTWRQAFSTWQRVVEGRLKDGDVFVDSPIYQSERNWKLVNSAIDSMGSMRSEPVAIEELSEYLRQRDEILAHHGIPPHDDSYSAAVREALDQLKTRSLETLRPPWPSPDNLGSATGWVWGLWTREGLLRRVEDVTLAAIEMYGEAVANDLHGFQPQLQATTPWPARIVGLIHWPSGEVFSSQPNFVWRLEPSGNGPSCNWQYVSSSEETHEMFFGLNGDFIVHGGEISGIYSASPATTLAKYLVWEALRPWGWTTGGAPT